MLFLFIHRSLHLITYKLKTKEKEKIQNKAKIDDLTEEDGKGRLENCLIGDGIKVQTDNVCDYYKFSYENEIIMFTKHCL